MMEVVGILIEKYENEHVPELAVSVGPESVPSA
jgi:hypothetical protein